MTVEIYRLHVYVPNTQWAKIPRAVREKHTACFPLADFSYVLHLRAWVQLIVC